MRKQVSFKKVVYVNAGVLLAIGAGLLALHGFLNAGDPTAAEPVRTVFVRTATARTGELGLHLDALGTVTPLATVNVTSQVNGQVLAVHYTEGQMVRKGDPLVDIDPRPFQAQLQQAEGQFERDQGLLKQAEQNLERYQEAFAVHAVAKQVLDDQQQAVAQARGTVANDLGQVHYAQVQLGYCHIKSPIAGRVGLRLVDPGNLAVAGGSSPLVVVTALQPISVLFNLAEDHLGSLKGPRGQASGMVAVAYDRTAEQQLATGSLMAVDNQVDPATGTVRCRAGFENQGLALFPNQFVNVRLRVGTLRNAVLVPSAAVQHNGAQAFAFVVDRGRVTVRNLTERGAEGDDTAVEGLFPGEQVALSSFDKLDEGTPVTLEASGPGAAGAKP